MSLKLCRCILLVFYVLSVNCKDPEVHIPQGRLRGRTRISNDGGMFYSFQNIPYAKPPIGNLRFKTPQRPDGWNGTRDATEDLPQCIQIDTGEGQEDCLYLNVYTPNLQAKTVSLKPVMVWIHGGAFTTGSAQESMYGPQFLIARDVVIVIINYRLGIFGFFSLDDRKLGVTGNAGMKDQVRALEWVKYNIKYFGGDPRNVLIFGESAGGMSVHLHVVSHMSRGLFHKAISQSGCALTDYLLKGRNNGVVLAEALEIQTENRKYMLESLQNLPAELLTSTVMKLQATGDFFTRPIIEIPSDEIAFLLRSPLHIIRSGNYNKVPYMLGFTDAEGLYYQVQSKLYTGESMLITNFSEWIPRELQIESGSKKETILSETIKKFYYGDSEPSRDNITGAVYLLRDHTFGYPAYRSALEHLKISPYPIYFYLFTVDAKLNFYKQMDDVAAAFPGASHIDDLGYLFYMSGLVYEKGSVEDLAIKNMVSLWTNFAIYGNPTPHGFCYKWKPARVNQFNYLHIDTNESTLKVDPVSKNMKFWSKIYSEYFPQ